MAKGKGSGNKDYYKNQFDITERNLARKGKTNKKKKRAR